MMTKLVHGRASTHGFALGLLLRPNEIFRMWGLGRLWIVWDSGIPATVPTDEVLPKEAPNDTV